MLAGQQYFSFEGSGIRGPIWRIVSPFYSTIARVSLTSMIYYLRWLRSMDMLTFGMVNEAPWANDSCMGLFVCFVLLGSIQVNRTTNNFNQSIPSIIVQSLFANPVNLANLHQSWLINRTNTLSTTNVALEIFIAATPLGFNYVSFSLADRLKDSLLLSHLDVSKRNEHPTSVLH